MKDLTSFYKENGYIKKNPSLHQEDSFWKFQTIIPLLNFYLKCNKKSEMNILDVGGGAGLILKMTSKYIENKNNKVNKIMLDLSPGMIENQKKNNPDFKFALNENIIETSLKSKQISLTLMIDVLEHIENPKKALKELKRVSNYIIFKIPLEDNIIYNSYNIFTKGTFKQTNIKTLGHINYYTPKTARDQIEKYCGEILYSDYSKVFQNELKPEEWNKKSLKEKIYRKTGSIFTTISPYLSSRIFGDHVLILVKCHN